MYNFPTIKLFTSIWKLPLPRTSNSPQHKKLSGWSVKSTPENRCFPTRKSLILCTKFALIFLLEVKYLIRPEQQYFFVCKESLYKDLFDQNSEIWALNQIFKKYHLKKPISGKIQKA